MKKFTIISNWKTSLPDSIENIINISNKSASNNLEISIAPSFTEIAHLCSLVKNDNLSISAQDVSSIKEEACTGEITAKKLSKYNLKYCIVGHSERKVYFNETSIEISKKINNLIINNITPVLCIGENEITDVQKRKKILKMQFNKYIGNNDKKNIIVAYEPKWAIGSKKSADINEIEDIIHFLKEHFKKDFISFKVQYGGGINSSNIKSFFKSIVIDGVLIGKAGLLSEEFKSILEGCK